MALLPCGPISRRGGDVGLGCGLALDVNVARPPPLRNSRASGRRRLLTSGTNEAGQEHGRTFTLDYKPLIWLPAGRPSLEWLAGVKFAQRRAELACGETEERETLLELDGARPKWPIDRRVIGRANAETTTHH